MQDRGFKLKQQQRAYGLKDREVAEACKRPIDTIRKLGRTKFADDTLDEIEAGIESARQERRKTLEKVS